MSTTVCLPQFVTVLQQMLYLDAALMSQLNSSFLAPTLTFTSTAHICIQATSKKFLISHFTYSYTCTMYKGKQPQPQCSLHTWTFYFLFLLLQRYTFYCCLLHFDLHTNFTCCLLHTNSQLTFLHKARVLCIIIMCIDTCI